VLRYYYLIPRQLCCEAVYSEAHESEARILIFFLFLPSICVSQTRYKDIEVTDISEYGYQIKSLHEKCYLKGYWKIKNITDSVLLISYNGVDFLYGNHSIVIEPGYSILAT